MFQYLNKNALLKSSEACPFQPSQSMAPSKLTAPSVLLFLFETPSDLLLLPVYEIDPPEHKTHPMCFGKSQLFWMAYKYYLLIFFH